MCVFCFHLFLFGFYFKIYQVFLYNYCSEFFFIQIKKNINNNNNTLEKFFRCYEKFLKFKKNFNAIFHWLVKPIKLLYLFITYAYLNNIFVLERPVSLFILFFIKEEKNLSWIKITILYVYLYFLIIKNFKF